MKRAKGPSSLHSPFSAPGLDSPPAVNVIGEVGDMVDIDTVCLRVDTARYDKVGDRTSSTTSTGKEWAVGVGRTASSGDIVREG